MKRKPGKPKPKSKNARRIRQVRDEKTRAAEVLARPAALAEICEAVANGGSLIEYAAQHRILYSSAIEWLYAEGDRKSRYERSLSARSEWCVQRILEELKTLAFWDLRQAFDEQGNLRDMKAMPEAVARVLAGVEILEEYQGKGEEREFLGYTKKVKFVDRLRALELIGKNLRMFVDRVEVSGSVSIADRLSKARARAARALAHSAPPSHDPWSKQP